MRQTRRSRIPDCGPLLEKFGDGKRRPALRRGHRGGIDPRYLLPDLETLLRIDAAAERAVAGAGVAAGEGGAAAVTLSVNGRTAAAQRRRATPR